MGLTLFINKTFKVLSGGIAIANKRGLEQALVDEVELNYLVDTTYVWSAQMTLLLCSFYFGFEDRGPSEVPVVQVLSCFHGALAQRSKYGDRHCTDSPFNRKADLGVRC